MNFQFREMPFPHCMIRLPSIGGILECARIAALSNKYPIVKSTAQHSYAQYSIARTDLLSIDCTELQHAGNEEWKARFFFKELRAKALFRISAGQFIGLHSDASEKGARMVFNVGDDLTLLSGGMLVLASRRSPAPVFYQLKRHEGIILTPEEDEFHGVSLVHTKAIDLLILESNQR